jgi:hypothetical protein
MAPRKKLMPDDVVPPSHVLEARNLSAPVSERALIQRLNRKMHDSGQMVKTTRSRRALHDLGRHYVLDVRRNRIDVHHIDLESFGREHGVLEPYEHLYEEGGQ